MVITPNETIYERHQRDNDHADLAQVKADIDYLAMMLDIELDEEGDDEQELQ